MQKRIVIVAAIVFVLALFDIDGTGLLENDLQETTPEVLALTQEETVVTRVVDGDTIEIESGQKVRYIGIDTPETVHPQKSVECFGIEAKSKNEGLVLGKQVILKADVTNTDRYGRLLRYVYVRDDSGNEIFVNDALVREGYAFSRTYPPDVMYQDQLLQAEHEAREAERGLWTNCYAEKS